MTEQTQPESIWKPEPIIQFTGLVFIGLVFTYTLKGVLSHLIKEIFFVSEGEAFSSIIATFMLHIWIFSSIYRLLRTSELKWEKAFGSIKPFRTWIKIGTVVGLLQFIISQISMPLWLVVLRGLSIPVIPQEAIRLVYESSQPLLIISLGVLAVVTAPIAEELLFRGVFFGAIYSLGFPTLSLVGSSIIFALFHSNLATFFPLFIFAIIQSLIYDKLQNIWPIIISHATFNLINLGIALVSRGLK